MELIYSQLTHPKECTTNMINLLIVDDHKIVADGIQLLLQDVPQINIVAVAHNGSQAIEVVKQSPIDIILMDINMPELNGVEACKTICEISDAKIIALTNHQELAFVYNMVNSGAKGYLLKISGKEELVKGILAVANGGTYFSEKIKTLIENMDQDAVKNIESAEISLSKREKEILKLIVLGYTNIEISTRLFISKNTADTHRKNLLRKLNVNNTAGLVRLAYETNILYS